MGRSRYWKSSIGRRIRIFYLSIEISCCYSEEIIRTIFTKNPVRNKKAMVTAFIDADDEDG